MKALGDYAVGYGRPSKETQWTKGKSGNPKGRPPKVVQGIAELIEGAFAQRIKVTDNGRRRYRTVLELILLMLWTKATHNHNKKALRVFYQFEAFAARKPKIKVRILNELSENAYALLLQHEDDETWPFADLDPASPLDDAHPYKITPDMPVLEAADRYYKFLQKSNDEWDRKQALKRRPYTSSW